MVVELAKSSLKAVKGNAAALAGEGGGWFSFSSPLLPANPGSHDLVCAPWQSACAWKRLLLGNPANITDDDSLTWTSLFTPFTCLARCSLKTPLGQTGSWRGFPHQRGKKGLSQKWRSQNTCFSEASVNYPSGFESHKSWARPGCWLSLPSGISAEEEAGEAAPLGQTINTPVRAQGAEAVSNTGCNSRNSGVTQQRAQGQNEATENCISEGQRMKTQPGSWVLSLGQADCPHARAWHSDNPSPRTSSCIWKPETPEEMSHQLLLLTRWRKNYPGGKITDVAEANPLLALQFN